MQYLLDTHIILWILGNEEKLTLRVKNVIKNYDNKCYVSIASLFEIAIKKTIGKLEIPLNSIELEKIIIDSGFNILPTKAIHLLEYEKLIIQKEHKDPFDRLLIATAIAENMAFISNDSNINLYTPTLKIFI